MKFNAVILILSLCLALPDLTAARSLPPEQAGQEWLEAPILPRAFLVQEDNEDRPPPLGTYRVYSAPPSAASQRPAPTSAEEYSYLRGIRYEDIVEWEKEEELRGIRRTVGDIFLGVPMLIPQLLIEGLAPRGVAIGPSTYLYRTSPAGKSLSLVVLDQLLFHEAQFAAHAQSDAETGVPNDLRGDQRRVLRRSFMNGIRATYSMPPLALATIFDTADEYGVAGYAAAPVFVAALLYFQGLDHKVSIEDGFRARFKIASGREWVQGSRSSDGLPVLSVEVQVFNLPVNMLVSCEASRRGVVPAFIGIGTSLEAMEDLLGAEEAGARGYRPR